MSYTLTKQFAALYPILTRDDMDLFHKQPRKNYSIDDMHKIAAAHHGRCLSSDYVNERTELAWECEMGHTWQAKPRALIRQGTWCPVCAVSKRRTHRLSKLTARLGANQNDLDKIHDFAGRLGGEYLSDCIPANSDEKVNWRCGKGHTWAASLSQVIQYGFWCPACAGQDVMLHTRCITLDLLSKIANDHNGQVVSTVCPDSVVENVEWECSRHHRWKAPIRVVLGQRRWCPECAAEIGEIQYGFRHSLQELKQYAESMGGHCYAKSYTGMRTPVEWCCSKNHHWTTNAVSVMCNHRWCPECGVERRSTLFTIEDVQQIARERGGECLSTEYHGLRDKLVWRCSENHVWRSSVKSVYYTGRWCSTCANYRKKKFDMETIRRITSDHGWTCLSTSCKHVKDSLEFHCSAGHQLIMPFSNALALNFHCHLCDSVSSGQSQ